MTTISERFDGEEPNHEWAKILGWVDKSTQSGRSWNKGTLRLWQVGRSYPSILIWWVCADLLDGLFRNHRTYESFNEAIKFEEGPRWIIDEAVRLDNAEYRYPTRTTPKHVPEFIPDIEKNMAWEVFDHGKFMAHYILWPEQAEWYFNWKKAQPDTDVTLKIFYNGNLVKESKTWTKF